jgi:hypothetical protein
MYFTRASYLRYFLFTLVLLTGAAIPLSSAPFFVIQKDIRYVQSSSAAPTTPVGFDLFATVMTPGVFDGGTVTVPVNNNVQPLSPSGANIRFASGVIGSQSIFTSSFPTGVYAFHLTDSASPGTTQDQTVDDSTETFPTTIPALSAATFSGLSTLDPTLPFVVHFNTYTSPHSPLTFFALLNSSNAVLLFDGLQPDVGQDTIPANTLVTGGTYQFILFFGDNTVGSNTQLTLNQRTQGSFTVGGASAAPEPASGWMVFGGIGLWIAFRASCRTRTAEARA